jgi:hypothetical protein
LGGIQFWLKVEIALLKADNSRMAQTVEEIVRDYDRASKLLLREKNTPAKARAFLLKAGILEKSARSPNGVRLAKRYR